MGSLLAFENAPSEQSCFAISVAIDRSVAHQTTGGGELSKLEDRWNAAAEGECAELRGVAVEQRIGGADHERGCSQLRCRCKGCFEVGFGARVEYMKPHAECIGYGLQVFRNRRSEWICGVDEQSNGRRHGEQLTREFEPLRPYFHTQGSRACDVAARSAQAGDKTQLDWVTPGRVYDRNRRGRRFGRQCARRAARGDDGDLVLNQLGRQRRQSVILVFRPAVLDCHVLTLDVAGLLQALAERGHHGGVPLRRPTMEEPDHRYRDLLRRHRQRPCRRAAEQRDELAAPDHSITSSATESSDGGTVSSSILAVSALMASSNFDACTTGRSVGLVPLRMRPTQ